MAAVTNVANTRIACFRGHMKSLPTTEGEWVFVDTELLRSGALESHRAGEHTHRAVARLTRESLHAAMFGDFADADAFFEAAGSAHSHHVRVLAVDGESLATVGDKAHRAAAGFLSMDDDGAKRFREVRCSSV